MDLNLHLFTVIDSLNLGRKDSKSKNPNGFKNSKNYRIRIRAKIKSTCLPRILKFHVRIQEFRFRIFDSEHKNPSTYPPKITEIIS